GAEDPGVVPEHVDAAECALCRAGNGAGRAALRDGASDRHHARAAAELPHRVLELLRIARVEYQARALGQEARRHVEADAAARARDDHPIDSLGHVSFLHLPGTLGRISIT